MAETDLAWKVISSYYEKAYAELQGQGLEDHSYPVKLQPIYLSMSLVNVGEKWENPMERSKRMTVGGEGTARHGLFPEIRRAWAVYDNTLLHLWRFDQRDGQVREHKSSEEQPICAVGLVKSRLEAAAQYLLVLATPVELLFFQVCYCPTKDGQISVEKLVDYTTPISDGLKITCIAGTDQGRIFLGGDNGLIYELTFCTPGPPVIAVSNTLFYSFGVVEMVVDNGRKFLYVSKKKSKLEAYFLGVDGDSPIEFVGRYNLFPLTPSRKDYIVCISLLSKLESWRSRAHLVAVISDGSKFYLKTSLSSGYRWIRALLLNSLRLVTSKPPPNVQLEGHSQKVETAYSSSDGTLFISRQKMHSTNSSVIVIGQDSSLDDTRALRETLVKVEIDGRLLFVADVLPTPDTVSSTMVSLYTQALRESFEKTCRILRGKGALFNQHLLPKTKILVFTTTCVKELFLNRPVDILINFLKRSPRDDDMFLDEFIDHFGAGETAAMCLMLSHGIISCGVDDDSIQVRKIAAEIFQNMKKRIGNPSNPYILSAAHDGLYLVTARLLYPIWNTCVFSKRTGSSVSMSEDTVVICRFSSHVTQELEQKLKSLPTAFRDGDENLSNDDADSIECCRELIMTSVEALFLLGVLSEHDIAILVDETLRQSLLKFKFCQLVHDKKDEKIVQVLIRAIKKNLSDAEFVLLNNCPSYFTFSPTDSTSVTSPRHAELRRRAAHQRDKRLDGLGTNRPPQDGMEQGKSK